MYEIETVYCIYILGAATSTLNRQNVILENISFSNIAHISSWGGGKGEGQQKAN